MGASLARKLRRINVGQTTFKTVTNELKVKNEQGEIETVTTTKKVPIRHSAGITPAQAVKIREKLITKHRENRKQFFDSLPKAVSNYRRSKSRRKGGK